MKQLTLSIYTTCCVCGEDKPFEEFAEFEIMCYDCKDKIARGMYVENKN